MSAYRVRVERVREPLPPGDPSWRSLLQPLDNLGEWVVVGRFDTMHEAITRGCTALRFVAAGIPWRAPEAAQR